MASSGRLKTRQQRQRRRSGQVVRVEVVFNTEDPDQVELLRFLARLPRGQASSFMRDALAEKIGQKAPQAAQAARHGSIESDAVLALAREVQRLQAVVAAHERPVVAHTHERPMPTSADQPAEQVSSGLDMSAPRRGGRLKATAPTVKLLTVEPPAQNPALVLAASIRTASAQLAGVGNR